MIRSSLSVILMALLPAGAAEPLRLGMIGLDTSHVPAFAKVFNDPKAPGHVPGGKVVAAFKGGSPDIVASASRVEGFTKQLVETHGVKLYDSIEELARNVDAILIESVDGRTHLDQFRRTLAAKKPVFIDKPFAGSLKDAVEMVRLAKEAGVPIFSSSSLRYAPEPYAPKLATIGDITSAFSIGPADIEPTHPDFSGMGFTPSKRSTRCSGPDVCRWFARTRPTRMSLPAFGRMAAWARCRAIARATKAMA